MGDKQTDSKQINQYVGEQIKKHRKSRGLTIQDLANQIHKSRATVSKYENGEITLDVVTLLDIAATLGISPTQLIEYRKPSIIDSQPATFGLKTFFNTSQLYLYFYDGRYKRLKDGVIEILPGREGNHQPATLTISVVSPSGRDSEIYYLGTVTYSDMLIRFSFINQYNALEENLLYIFSPLELRESTYGLLCGISSSDMRPCAFKCLVTLTPHKDAEALKEQLMLSKQELQMSKKLNMLIVENIV